MTGWRMGYGVMRPDLAAHISRLMTNSNSCTASFTQVAGVEAIRGEQGSVENMSPEFKKRRDLFVGGLNRIKGFSCRLPKGAFYVFPNIKQTGWPSKKLADALLEQAGVAALSGTAFGAFGEGYLRFSVANSRKHREGAGPHGQLDEEESVAQLRSSMIVIPEGPPCAGLFMPEPDGSHLGDSLAMADKKEIPCVCHLRIGSPAEIRSASAATKSRFSRAPIRRPSR